MKEKLIKEIIESTPAYQGMEDDFEGLSSLSIEELIKIRKEMSYDN